MSLSTKLAALAVLSSAVLCAQADDVLVRARELAGAGRRPESLAVLEKRLAQTPGDVDIRLLYGLVLSWDRRFDDARRQLTAVLAAAPDYLDARYALGDVELWSGHPRTAETLARDALAKRPNDTRLLLLRARALRDQRRQSEAVADARRVQTLDPGNKDAQSLIDSLPEAAMPWTASFAETHEWFSRTFGAWDEIRAAVRRSTSAGPVIAGFSRSYRSGTSGQQVDLEYYPRLGRGYMYLEYGYSPDARLYPRHRGAVDLVQPVGRGFELSGGYRRLGFARPVNLYTGSLGKYYRQWLFTARGYGATGSNDVSETAQFSARRYFGARDDYAGARFSVGSVLREVTNVTDLAIEKATAFGGEIRKSLGPRWRLDLAAGLSREDRRNNGTVNRHFVRAELALRF